MEFESGIWHGWHLDVGTLTATHYEFNGLAALLAGVAGWNWYMLASRDSWYMSPITELGRFRQELSGAFAELVRLFRAIDPPSLTKLGNTAVTFDALEPAPNDPALQALYAAAIDYEVFELQTGRIALPLLFFAGAGANHLDRLASYVQNGGTLVLCQPPPLDKLVHPPDSITTAAAPQRLRLTLGASTLDLSSDAVYLYENHENAIFAERIQPLAPIQEGGHAHVLLPVGERLCVGYLEQRGSGRIVVLGLTPTPELVVAIHAWLGVRIPSARRSSAHPLGALPTQRCPLRDRDQYGVRGSRGCPRARRRSRCKPRPRPA